MEAFEYDWRTRFHRPFSDVLVGVMSWREAWNLAHVLSRDPSSWVCAALNGWDSPRSHEWFLTADLYDLTHAANAKKQPKPYPRPSDARKKLGGKVPAGNARAALQRLAGGEYGKKPGPARNALGQFTKQ